jgi:FkbM family methyltransferase
MSLPHFPASAPARARSALHKLRWGVRVVGVANTARGTARLLALRVRRPPRAEVRLRSGTVLEFDYPNQCPLALVTFGELIDPEFAFLREVSRPDWIVVDVGAAIGQFSMFAAQLPCEVVHAFEPSASNVATLERNIRRNALYSRVLPHKVALSNVSGESFFETTSDTWVSRLTEGAVGEGEVVPVRRLSDELDRLGIERVSVLKINVAGFEPSVLEGAGPVLEANRADILILLLGIPSLPHYARIAEHGYRFFYYHPVERRLYEVASFDERTVLDSRPWPARHIIAVHESAIASGRLGSIEIHRPDRSLGASAAG